MSRGRDETADTGHHKSIFFYEPMSCRIAVRIQLAKQNKDPTVRIFFMGLGAIKKNKFSIKVQKKKFSDFDSDNANLLESIKSGPNLPSDKKVVFSLNWVFP